MKPNRPQTIWNTIARQRPELFLFIGDNIYGDTEDMDVMRRKYQALADNPDFAAFRKAVPIMATWDDHDYGKNDAGEEYPMKEESKKVFLEFFEEGEKSSRWDHPGVYHSEILGSGNQSIQIILLDTRSFRTPLVKKERGKSLPGLYQPNPDKDARMLGEEQWTWLEGELRKPAALRIIASSVQVIAEEHGWEGWTNFPYERQRLFDLIESTRANGVIFISGDRHLCELSRWDKGPYPLYDLTSSGMNSEERWPPDDSNPFRVGKGSRRNNFGLIDVNWSKPDPQVHLHVLGKNGDALISEQFPLSRLSP
jgi:alkaline phosphatase D